MSNRRAKLFVTQPNDEGAEGLSERVIDLVTRPHSQIDLIQERLTDDPWKILVACCLMNMTRGLTMRPYFWRLLDGYFEPHKLAAAEPEAIRSIIAPLGFGNVRTKRLIAMSREYLEGWSDPRELTGCGKYAYDSWLIFCRGERPDPDEVSDKELKRYLMWCRDNTLDAEIAA